MQISKVFIIISVCVYTLLAQTYPYVSFKGQTLTNHSYVDLSLVGDDASGSDSVQCISDLSTCCSSPQGGHRGDWYFPNGTQLPLSDGGGDIYEGRHDGSASISRTNSNTGGPSGIYRCDIPTNAVHHDTDASVRDTVYVGLYLDGGGEQCLQLQPPPIFNFYNRQSYCN